ncbi:HAUS augmin-like complex subunit 3 [Sturnira hondurensis]|uniref:HAUS augmin-like complex subunit 3 n=1 Tax=Sturnira hondurensis TaxID=192404 RepID=UPI00187AFDE6|nr:HAUS augmin-like complex subunit 3 [Sturnira hondurensis]XP_036902852.1 HAUS augmin-like complex subunit 3 [Sturnira hondurensis]
MSCGQDFVETLRTIGYPRAESLHGADFDWLFEAGGAEPFLRWFCGSVSERNVLSEEEVQAFGRLRGSGRPVLEGAALEEALRTCAAPLARAPAPGGAEEEALERELHALRDLRSLRVRQRDQRRLLAAATRHRALRLSAAEEAAKEPLKRGRAALRAASGEVKGTLRAAAGAVDQLMRFFGAPPNAAAGPSPPVFLYRCPSEQYLGQEERSTAALACYTRTQFFQGVHAVVESSSEEHFQLVDLRAPAVCDSPEDAQGRRLEMARLQLAFICAQHQAVHLRAGNLSLKARIEWAEETLRGLATQALGKENLEAKISSLNTGILKLEEQITHVKENTLPAVIKENAQLLNMPVVKGDFDLQIAKQDYYTARQELVLNQLIKQKASFELLQLSYEIELRKHRDIHRQLENLVQELSQSITILHQRLEMLADPPVSQQRNPRNTIDTKDYSTHRLYQLLEGENKKKELFITHRNLEEVAEKLKQDVSLVQDQLTISAQEHSFFMSKLNNDVDLLCDILYQGRNQLLLSDQELTEQFHQVESQLNKLNHLLTDILADVKTKRKILASNKLHQMERELYVYFLKDEDYLKNIVENLENKSKVKAVGLKD